MTEAVYPPVIDALSSDACWLLACLSHLNRQDNPRRLSIVGLRMETSLPDSAIQAARLELEGQGLLTYTPETEGFSATHVGTYDLRYRFP